MDFTAVIGVARQNTAASGGDERETPEQPAREQETEFRLLVAGTDPGTVDLDQAVKSAEPEIAGSTVSNPSRLVMEAGGSTEVGSPETPPPPVDLSRDEPLLASPLVSDKVSATTVATAAEAGSVPRSEETARTSNDPLPAATPGIVPEESAPVDDPKRGTSAAVATVPTDALPETREADDSVRALPAITGESRPTRPSLDLSAAQETSTTRPPPLGETVPRTEGSAVSTDPPQPVPDEPRKIAVPAVPEGSPPTGASSARNDDVRPGRESTPSPDPAVRPGASARGELLSPIPGPDGRAGQTPLPSNPAQVFAATSPEVVTATNPEATKANPAPASEPMRQTGEAVRQAVALTRKTGEPASAPLPPTATQPSMPSFAGEPQGRALQTPMSARPESGIDATVTSLDGPKLDRLPIPQQDVNMPKTAASLTAPPASAPPVGLVSAPIQSHPPEPDVSPARPTISHPAFMDTQENRPRYSTAPATDSTRSVVSTPFPPLNPAVTPTADGPSSSFASALSMLEGDAPIPSPSRHEQPPVSDMRSAPAAILMAEPASRTLPSPSAAHQVADTLRGALPAAPAPGSIDVALHPEELGRVRLVFTPAEAGLTVTVQAERSDTLDLLRRHIDALGADLREHGFTNLSFDFSGGDAAPQDNPSAPFAAEPTGQSPQVSDTQEDPDVTIAHRSLRRAGVQSLDMRL